MTSKRLRGPGTRVLIFDGSKGLSPTRSGSNLRGNFLSEMDILAVTRYLEMITRRCDLLSKIFNF